VTSTDFLNQLDDYSQGQFGVPYAQTPTQAINPLASQKQSQLIGALASPFQNMQNNWNAVSGNFKAGNYGDGLLGAYAMAKNPTGNFGNQQQQAAPATTVPEEHLGPADSNGLRPIKPSFFNTIQQGGNASSIADNSQMINGKPANAPEGQDQAQANPKSGLIGGLIKNAAMAALA